MEQLDNYLKSLTLLNKNELLNDYNNNNYNYDNYDEMSLDLNILLKTKYKNIKQVSNKLKCERKPKFRKEIVKRDRKCIISGAGKLSCEAAHIKPFNNCNEEEKYDIDNGILLESGIHKLFDKYLWSINNNRVIVSKKILQDRSYDFINKYHNKKLNLNEKQIENLKAHYRIFLN